MLIYAGEKFEKIYQRISMRREVTLHTESLNDEQIHVIYFFIFINCNKTEGSSDIEDINPFPSIC
jgi:hypothetical protein